MKEKNQKIDFKPIYYKLLSKIGKEVDTFLNKFYKNKIYVKFPEKKFIYKKMLDKKHGTQKLRAIVVYLAYFAFSNRKIITTKVKKLMAAAELINWSSYEFNWIFDKKSGVTTQTEIRKNLLATFGFFHDALFVFRGNNEVQEKFIEINDRILRGFSAEFDLDINNEKTLKNHDYFFKKYKIRNFEAVGQFFGNCVTLSFLLSGSKNKKLHKKLKVIFEEFGEHLEIMNDLADFILPSQKEHTHEKINSDQHCDIKNGTVTWPIRIIYNKGCQRDRIFLRSISKKETTQKEKIRLVKLLHSSGAYDEITQALRTKTQELHRRIKKLNFDYKTRCLMEILVYILASNKHLHQLKKDYKKVKNLK